ncbi:hypothetical protein [Lysobacter enzymogenes]|uniref:hypothetical protein n=1 Tax=Lysobacter enzymogenes TaxID=69 RepID=UPI000897BC87|nr:hypothetical protein [Lysobacter enzymogenes]SDY18265.1 hypothetical protein SAMN05421681_11319 [Lysobacter enzymogenes]
MEKALIGLIGLLLIGLGVRAIVTRRTDIDIGDTDSSDSGSITVRGWAAILIGVLGVVAGVGVIATFVL